MDQIGWAKTKVMWNINEVSKEILADSSKEIKGPKTMFKISSVAGEGPLVTQK